MKTINFSILALAFFGMSTLASAQTVDNADKQDNNTDKVDMKAPRHGFGHHRMMNDSTVADFQHHRRMLNDSTAMFGHRRHHELNDSADAGRHHRRGMMRQGQGMQRGPQASRHRGFQMGRGQFAGRPGAGRPGAMRQAGRPGAGRGMMGQMGGGFMAGRGTEMAFLPTIQLTEEMKANMTKKELKEYNKAVKRAQKAKEKAQKGIKEAFEQQRMVDDIVKDQLHRAKRYTQKANRIAINEMIALHDKA